MKAEITNKSVRVLNLRRSYPLDKKINMSLARIRDWYESWEGNVHVAYSAGKDSSVLLWLVRQLYPEVPAVFSHTGLEYPEVIEQVRRTPNSVVLHPATPFHKVIETIGWPIGSKRISRSIKALRHPTEKNANIRNLYDTGYSSSGKYMPSFVLPQQWRFLIDAPFECSDGCCDVMKKRPGHLYEKTTKSKPFVGTLATDSKLREQMYLMVGCNAYDQKRPRSAPLSFWTEHDILDCIKKMAYRFRLCMGT